VRPVSHNTGLLPHTGADLAVYLFAGVVTLVVGFMIWRMTRESA